MTDGAVDFPDERGLADGQSPPGAAEGGGSRESVVQAHRHRKQYQSEFFSLHRQVRQTSSLAYRAKTTNSSNGSRSTIYPVAAALLRPSRTRPLFPHVDLMSPAGLATAAAARSFREELIVACFDWRMVRWMVHFARMLQARPRGVSVGFICGPPDYSDTAAGWASASRRSC